MIISRITHRRLENRRGSLESEKSEWATAMEAARRLGDLSENTEYEVALQRYTNITQEIARVDNILENATVEVSYPSIISVGALITVQELDSRNNVIDDMGLLLFDAEGSAIFDGTISNSSNLGRKIEGSIGGEVISQDIMGRERKFRVILEPETRTDEYLDLYPPIRKQKLDTIFDLSE